MSIYEENTNTSDDRDTKYFDMSKDYWNAMIKYMKKEGILMKLTSIEDDNFNDMICSTRVCTCIYCKIDDNELGYRDDSIVERGFSR